jgi:hypothetical protein
LQGGVSRDAVCGSSKHSILLARGGNSQCSALLAGSKSVQVPTLGIDVLGCKLAEEVIDPLCFSPEHCLLQTCGHALLAFSV